MRASKQTAPKNGKDQVTLNAKEQRVLAVLAAEGALKLNDLAQKAFPRKGAKSNQQGGSWTRNSLRKIVKHELVRKVEAGEYSITTRGKAVVAALN